MYFLNLLGLIISLFQISSSILLDEQVDLNSVYNETDLTIPDDFLLGAGTSAYQTEGAWNSYGKSESFIDHVMHVEYPDPVVNADIASDSYHRYKEDVELLKTMGIKIYRFSMSWPRLLPTGYPDNINKQGVQHYHKLLDELLKNGIESFVSLHHFDHPQVFEKIGGWLNETMIDAFGQYARFVFKEYGQKVKKFVTFNEPNYYSLLTYSYNWIDKKGTTNANIPGIYLSAHNLLKAHAVAYQIYNKEFRAEQNGTLGIGIGCINYVPRNSGDRAMSEIAFQFNCGWLSHPIFSETGDYPEVMKAKIYEASVRDGLAESRLPTFSQDWIDKIKGSSDFFGLNHYISQLVEPAPKNITSKAIDIMCPEAGLTITSDPNWRFAPNLNSIVPDGVRQVLKKIKSEYNNPLVYVLENGYSTTGQLNDDDRIEYIYSFLKEILLAIKYDKCNVKSYLYWSLIDNYEFGFGGFNSRFGLAHVNFNDPERKRTLRKSGNWLGNVIKNKKLFANVKESSNMTHIL